MEFTYEYLFPFNFELKELNVISSKKLQILLWVGFRTQISDSINQSNQILNQERTNKQKFTEKKTRNLNLFVYGEKRETNSNNNKFRIPNSKFPKFTEIKSEKEQRQCEGRQKAGLQISEETQIRDKKQRHGLEQTKGGINIKITGTHMMERRLRVLRKGKLGGWGNPDRKMPSSTMEKLEGGTRTSSPSSSFTSSLIIDELIDWLIDWWIDEQRNNQTIKQKQMQNRGREDGKIYENLGISGNEKSNVYIGKIFHSIPCADRKRVLWRSGKGNGGDRGFREGRNTTSFLWDLILIQTAFFLFFLFFLNLFFRSNENCFFEIMEFFRFESLFWIYFPQKEKKN